MFQACPRGYVRKKKLIPLERSYQGRRNFPGDRGEDHARKPIEVLAIKNPMMRSEVVQWVTSRKKKSKVREVCVNACEDLYWGGNEWQMSIGVTSRKGAQKEGQPGRFIIHRGVS